MGALTDNFDSYTDGDLTGQGSWSGSTSFDIQGSVTQAGAKAVLNAGNSNSILKDFTASSTGVQTVYGRTSSTVDATWQFRVREGASAGFYIKTNGGNLQYFNGASYVTLGAISTDTWFKLDVEWDGATDQARYRLDDGTWSSYANGLGAFTNMSRVYLVNDSGTTANNYFDSLSDGSTPVSIFTPRVSFIM